MGGVIKMFLPLSLGRYKYNNLLCPENAPGFVPINPTRETASTEADVVAELRL